MKEIPGGEGNQNPEHWQWNWIVGVEGKRREDSEWKYYYCWGEKWDFDVNEKGNAKWDICVVVVEGWGVDVDLVVDFEVEDEEDEEEEEHNRT